MDDEFGKLIAALSRVYGFIKQTLSTMGIGMSSFISFLKTEQGKKLAEAALRSIGTQYLETQRVVVLGKNKIRVKLDAPPKLPFDGAEIEAHFGSGWVTVEKRKDGQLYVGGRKVILHVSECQKDGKKIKGYELCEELTGKTVLNANILDALLEFTHLIPEDWKEKTVFFWGTIYRNSDGYLCVRFLFWGGSRWHWCCYCLGGDFDGRDPAALLASS